ncbi:MAG: glycosyltransferase family 2 protein [Candidatus Zambryskibacteria bacterium]|nr:glycosyltransferase family 2 protein [Candidatus Zambryskibacteria bacterium]
MYKNKSVSVVISTYNEADSIASVVNGFFATGVVDEVVVVDNNALGNTKEEIEKTKARRVVETKQGYGFGYMRGLREAKKDLIVMTEADGTFDPKDIHKFLLYSDDFPVVFGTRTSRASIWSGAFMPFSVRFGNWAVAKFLEALHNGPTLTDVGCTYKLISREALEKIMPLFPLSRGDGKWSPEFMIWTLKKGFTPIEIPVIFMPRVGQSTYTGSIWKAAKLGFKMLPLIIKYRFKKI